MKPARWPALVAIVVGSAALVAAGLGALRMRPPPDEGAASVSVLTGPGTPAPATTASIPPTPVPPTRLGIPSIGVDAAVTPVGVDPATDQFAVPRNVDLVGWYRYGPGLDTSAGSVVLAGHVDGAGQGAGAFFRLRTLALGATVEVTAADGRTRAFRVVARETYPKRSIPLDRYFVRDGPPRLTLITCGGPFDSRRRSYRDNVVITAVDAG